MKVQDFEIAIEALNCPIVLDELKLKEGGHVKYFFGHKDYLLLLWDDSGRAFSRNIEGDELAESPFYLLDGVLPVDCYVRDGNFDLKFGKEMKEFDKYGRYIESPCFGCELEDCRYCPRDETNNYVY